MIRLIVYVNSDLFYYKEPNLVTEEHIKYCIVLNRKTTESS